MRLPLPTPAALPLPAVPITLGAMITPDNSCPRDASPLISRDHAASNALACPACSGLWIPKSSLAGRLDADAVRHLFHNPGGTLTNLRCPVDRSHLWERNIKGILIDHCNSCGGLWFDARELQSLLASVRFKHPALTTRPNPKTNPEPTNDSTTLDVLGNFFDGGIELTGEILVTVVKFVASAIID